MNKIRNSVLLSLPLLSVAVVMGVLLHQQSAYREQLIRVREDRETSERMLWHVTRNQLAL